jgi:hypothetical protein
LFEIRWITSRFPPAILELSPIVRELLGHLLGSARHVAAYDLPEIYDLPDVEFM